MLIKAVNIHKRRLKNEKNLSIIWGDNGSGKLGIRGGNLSNPEDITLEFDLHASEDIIHVDLGLDISSAVTSKGRLFTWGSNTECRLGNGTFFHSHTLPEGQKLPQVINAFFPTGVIITYASFGSETHASAVTSTGRVFTWGNMDRGRMGNGSTSGRRTTPVEITSRFIFD